MKKILKYKSFIAFFLVFTLSFGVISNVNQEETEAFDFVITPTILWILGTLVLGTGVVAVSDLQVSDMGEMVLDNFKVRGGTLNELFNVVDGVNKGLIIKDKLLEALDWVSENLPTSKKSVAIDLPSMTYFYPVPFSVPSYSNNNDIKSNSFASFNVTGDFNISIKSPGGYVYESIDIKPKVGSGNWSSANTFGTYYLSIFSYSETGVRIAYLPSTIDRNGLDIGFVVSNLLSFRLKEFQDYTFTIDITGNVDGLKDYEYIPYDSPKVKENYKPGLLPQAIPYTDSKPGYIPIPLDIPTDLDISTDIPLTWDNVKEQITEFPIDVPINPPLNPPIDIPDNPALDIPGNPAIDKPVIGDAVGGISSLWDLIKAMLQGVFNMLKAILDFLLSLVGLLLTGLLSLVKALFIPTIAVSELFSPPIGSGFAMLVDIFNFDKLWSIEPKPYRFKQFWNFSWLDNEFTEEVEIRPFEVSIVKDNINIIRNVLSYSILISIIWFIILHFLPERSMD